VTGPEKIACADPNVTFANQQKEKGYTVSSKNSTICCMELDAIVICVKPQVVSDVCGDIMTHGKEETLIISVAAGVTLQSLEGSLPGRRVVRVMPNTACLVGESASGYAMGTHTNNSDRSIVAQIFGAVGIALEQKEELLNAVTGLSGSGPAYVFQFIEALADGTINDESYIFTYNFFLNILIS
jgi:pyrroline-5-carboxylate reductase